MQFMIQYKDGYGALHNVEVLTEDIDDAWEVAEQVMLDTDKIQQIWEVK
jgi:hypothetical protein